MEKLVLKADEAADILNVGISTIYDLRNRGILPQIKNLAGVRFRAKDVYALAGEKQDPEEYSRTSSSNSRMSWPTKRPGTKESVPLPWLY